MKNLIYKIKKHGVEGTIKVIISRCSNIGNRALYSAFRAIPVDNRLIVFESEGDLSDNAYALFEHIEEKGLLNKYKVIWLVDDVIEARKHRHTNTFYVEKNPWKIDFKRSYYLARCRYFIYDHCNVLATLKKRPECTIINLWHGCGFKGDKSIKKMDETDPDYMLVTGKLFIEIQSNVFGYAKEKFLDLGYPRNDYLYKKKTKRQVDFAEKWGMNNKSKVFVWMPTFRKSDNMFLSEEYFDSSTGLPLIDDAEKLMIFNKFLVEKNCMCIFKLHHLQAKLNVFQEVYSNIKVVRDADIKKAGLQLYEILPLTDCLISDYSSVSNDYMLLNKPMIYTIDDYEQFQKSRGFAIENPKKYFAGHCVKDKEELMHAMQEIVDGEDPFCEERKEIISEIHTHMDGNTGDRVISYLKLK